MELATESAARAEPVWNPDSGSERAGEASPSALWHAVLGAVRDVDRAVARMGGAGASTGAGSEALAALHGQVRDRLDRLRVELRAHADGDRMMLVLILFEDERIMRGLPDDLRLSWPLLQVAWIGSSRGGEEFYRILELLLEDQRTSGLLLEIFYFCLSHGFAGRFAGNAEAIEGYRGRLRARIPVPEGADAGRPHQEASGAPGRQMHPAWYYLGTAAAMAGLLVLMTALSNCGA